MKTTNQDNNPLSQRDWVTYYNAVANRPPRPTLLTALDRFEAERDATSNYQHFAIDLGCGDGRDTVELLRRGWRVLAIDAEAAGIERLRQRSDVDLSLLTTEIVRFENVQLPPAVDLINASFSLPLCPPQDFPTLWAKITASLCSGGRFSGQLFGNRDSWASYPQLTHHTREQAATLLEPFEIEMWEEEEHPGKTPLGEERYWHLFQIVACKR